MGNHSAFVCDLVIDKQGKRAVSCAMDASIKVWNIKNKNCEHTHGSRLSNAEIDDLNNLNLDEVTIMLILAANNDNYEDLLKSIEFIEYPELVICMPEKGENIERIRRKILAEINRRCEKTVVPSVNSIIVFRILNGSVNFRPKRTIHCANAIEEKVANDLEELINRISFAAAKSFGDIDKVVEERIGSDTIEASFGVELSQNTDGNMTMKPTASLKTKQEKKLIAKRIVTK